MDNGLASICPKLRVQVQMQVQVRLEWMAGRSAAPALGQGPPPARPDGYIGIWDATYSRSCAAAFQGPWLSLICIHLLLCPGLASIRIKWHPWHSMAQGQSRPGPSAPGSGGLQALLDHVAKPSKCFPAAALASVGTLLLRRQALPLAGLLAHV